MVDASGVGRTGDFIALVSGCTVLDGKCSSCCYTSSSRSWCNLIRKVAAFHDHTAPSTSTDNSNEAGRRVWQCMYQRILCLAVLQPMATLYKRLLFTTAQYHTSYAESVRSEDSTHCFCFAVGPFRTRTQRIVICNTS